MMERVYDTAPTTPVRMFVGREVEQTPAYGKTTLFVVGIQPYEDIDRMIRDGVEHIYFGANMSFEVDSTNDHEGWTKWSTMISRYLDKGLWVTLDLDVRHVEGLHETGLCECNRFIPMISVKMPYVGLFNYNTTVKIDDRTFDSTNPGVWCWSLHDLMSRDKFTDWSKYKDDTVL
jgi:hypothetical protein